MGKIQTVDPLVDLYKFEAGQGTPISFSLRRKDDVEFADHIFEKIGARDTVASEKDWEAIDELSNLYQSRWPEEAKEFLQIVSDLRQSRGNDGYSDSGEIVYVGAIPPRFMRLIKAVFPNQAWDKKFVWKLVKRFKGLKIVKDK